LIQARSTQPQCSLACPEAKELEEHRERVRQGTKTQVLADNRDSVRGKINSRWAMGTIKA